MRLKETDRFLVGIVVGIVLLVAVAFAVVLTQPKPTYLPDDTAAGVAHNYLLALQQQDYARAYSYLSPTRKGYPPSLDAFTSNISSYHWNFYPDESSTLTVEDTRVTGDRAVVSVRARTFSNPGLFSSGESSRRFDLRLQQETGAWKLIGGDSYWAYCWDYEAGCK